MNRDDVLRAKARQFTEYAFRSSSDRGTAITGGDFFWQMFQKNLVDIKIAHDRAIFLSEAKAWFDDYLLEEDNTNLANRINHCLYYIQQELELLPQIIIKNNIAAPQTRNRVFISYSHKDIDYLNHFKRHFGTLKKVDFWDDSQIKAGHIWREEIKKAIQTAKIAILFLSPDFFNSDFIRNQELPPLLEAAQKDGATILCVYVTNFFAESFPEITQYQGINNPKHPIAKMNNVDKDEVWTNLVERVHELLKD